MIKNRTEDACFSMAVLRKESCLQTAAEREMSIGSDRAVAEIIYEHPTRVLDEDTTYIVQVCAEEREDGTWEGWLEFHPADKSKPMLRTGQETSQPSRITTEYWAQGLELVYLEGALTRARERLP